MSIFSKLFGKKQTEGEETSHVGGMEDFMTLIRVYYQSVMACNIGITNINFLPDMAVFKRTLKIPTQNNKLGIAEKSRCKKMLVELYGLSDDFFKEIDGSIKKNCKNVNDVKTYLFMFQGFSNDLMMLIGNLMQWKFRMPSVIKKMLRNMTEKTIHDIMTKTDWKDESVHKTCVAIRKYKQALGYSENWMTEYVYNIVLLAKKDLGMEPERVSEGFRELQDAGLLLCDEAEEYAKAAADVNKIRERAGCTDLFDAGELNGLDGLDVIMDERARELMYEEFRHVELVRVSFIKVIKIP